MNPSFPTAPLKLFGAGADSGTFEYFTEAVTGKSKSSRGDFTASEDDNVLVHGVSRDVNALGYFGYAYYAENKDKLKALAISWKGGKAGRSFAGDGRGRHLSAAVPADLHLRQREVARASPRSRSFVEFYNKNADKLVKEVKYVPLPAKAYAYNLETLGQRRLGTKFGGENKIGLTIEELMKLEAKL